MSLPIVLVIVNLEIVLLFGNCGFTHRKFRDRINPWKSRRQERIEKENKRGDGLPMRIYIMRHGETDWNRENKIQGRVDIPLNENGRELARITAEKLKKIPFAAAITSPLIRAKETAEIIMGDRSAPITEDWRIAELASGQGEGMQAKVNGSYVSVFENFFHHPEQYEPLPGGETLRHLCERTGDFLRDVTQREEWKDKTILVATHGAAMRGILNNVRGESLAHFWMGNLIRNCAVTIVDVTDGVYTVVEDGKVFYETENG